MQARLALIVASYRRLTGRELVPLAADPAQALWTARCAIVAHGTEADPIFFFGNRAALDRFDATPERFAAMPSRLSAEPMLREERQALLHRVTRDGFIDDYAGVRISATGRRFASSARRCGIWWTSAVRSTDRPRLSIAGSTCPSV